MSSVCCLYSEEKNKKHVSVFACVKVFCKGGDTYCHKISCRWWSQRFAWDPDPRSPRRSPADREITRTIRGYSGLSAPRRSPDPAQMEMFSSSCYMWVNKWVNTKPYSTVNKRLFNGSNETVISRLRSCWADVSTKLTGYRSNQLFFKLTDWWHASR